LRETNADARQRVMAVLTPDQQGKAAQLENDAQKLARAETQQRADESYSRRRRGDMNQRLLPRPED